MRISKIKDIKKGNYYSFSQESREEDITSRNYTRQLHNTSIEKINEIMVRVNVMLLNFKFHFKSYQITQTEEFKKGFRDNIEWFKISIEAEGKDKAGKWKSIRRDINVLSEVDRDCLTIFIDKRRFKRRDTK